MKQSQLLCDDDLRRDEIRDQRDKFNGLDYLEVVDPLTLKVYFLNKAPENLKAANVQIKGGRRPGFTGIKVVAIEVCRQPRQDLDDCLLVTLDKTGDFSTYTLCLVDLDEYGRPTDVPFPGFDPRYACLEFNFKVDCPQEIDCQTDPVCPPENFPEPEINYLARDYASFRQLILDRLALTIPDWQETHVPDIGIALVELMAYVGDYLSYYQDAVATEAYLDTARQRISVRRHARLVDYQMHEGCNARTWVQLQTDTDETLFADKLAFLTHIQAPLPQLTDRLLLWEDLHEIPASEYEVFLPLLAADQTEIPVFTAHNEIHLYTWGDANCCLPKGTMAATLLDGYVESDDVDSAEQSAASDSGDDTPPERKLHLQVGDVLIFEERVGPKTGLAADADLTHRHAVRLTRVETAVDELYQQPIVEIGWAEADALPFALCISAIGPAPYCEPIENISIARGNIVLADHGQRVACEELGMVPIAETAVTCDDPCQPQEAARRPGRYHPSLQKTGITFSQPYRQQPAAEMLRQDPRQAVPWIKPHSAPGLRCAATDDSSQWPVVAWQPQRDLLASGAQDAHFVAEIDNDGRPHLRFGDGELGRQPTAGDSFTAAYRVGNGPAGNVGAAAIGHIIAAEVISGLSLTVWNPLPAVGGTEPEPMNEVKLFAPHAFRRTIQRAITAEDYATIVMRDVPTKVQRAAASLRWMGSWYELLVAVDARGQVAPPAELLQEIRQHLRPFRRIGHDVQVAAAQMVPLDIALHVCVLPAYLRGHVRAAIMDRLSTRRLPDGSLGFFHPDNLTFGAGIYLSQLVAAVQTVVGVESVVVNKFERQDEGDNGEKAAGVLKLGPLEIARLDNDRSFPENGRLTLTLEGGR